MKKKMTFLSVCFLLVSLFSFAQDGKRTDTLKVYGNCDMCKKNIEGSLQKSDGVISKKWDKDTQILTVVYHTSKITIEQIGEKIASVGYDNRFATAPNEKYNNLHPCCQYKRPSKS